MNNLDTWINLKPGHARRVNKDGSWDFFWIVLENNMPGLILMLPDNFIKPEITLPKLKNIVVSFRLVPNGHAFVISLKDRSQVELFETLCRNVVEAGETGKKLEDALARTIQRTKRWHYLLRGGHKRSLSLEEQRGLVGELAFLRELASWLGPETAIEAWTGPTGSAKDFELIGYCIEVKTRKVAARPFISINSEDQLSDIAGCRLFLQVVNVASAVIPEGRNLHDYVQLTSELFDSSDTAIDKWETAIYSTGYDPMDDYENRRWHLESANTYEIIEGFPRISTPLTEGVEKVRYNIALDYCESYKLEQSLESILKGHGQDV